MFLYRAHLIILALVTISHIQQPSCPPESPYIVFCFFCIHLFFVRVHLQYLLCPSIEDLNVCLCVRRADGQCTLSVAVIRITCRSVTRVCHGAWEPKRSHVIPPDLPLVWVASICLIYSLQQLGDPVPKDTWRKRGGGDLLQIWLMQALGGEVSLLWPLLQPEPAVSL